MDTIDGPRERYRQQVRDEVKQQAWRQIADAGASALSLKAIAKNLGMTAPALYRYFANRDELLTELILTAYRGLADAVEAGAAPGEPPEQRLRRFAGTFRGWAHEVPHRYLLLYGTPVPGYHAPAESIEVTRRIFQPLVAAYADLYPDDPTERAVRLWTRLHGIISLELAGHFHGMNLDTDQMYAREVERTVTDER